MSFKWHKLLKNLNRRGDKNRGPMLTVTQNTESVSVTIKLPNMPAKCLKQGTTLDKPIYATEPQKHSVIRDARYQ